MNQSSETVSPDLIHQEIVALQRRTITFLGWFLAPLYLVLAVVRFYALPPGWAEIMAAVSVGTAFIYLGLSVYQYFRTIPDVYINPLGSLGYVGLMVFNSVLHLYLAQEVQQTANILLIVVAIGYFLNFLNWYILSLGLVIGSWAITFALTPHTEAELFHYIFSMASGVFTSGLLHVVNTRATYHLVTLRLQEVDLRQDVLDKAKQLETAALVSQRLNIILDLNNLLGEIANTIQQHYDLYCVAFFLLDEDKTQLQLKASATKVLQLGGLHEQFIPIKEGLTGWAVRHKKPLLVNDVRQDRRFVPHHSLLDTQSQMVLPLQGRGELLGVLDVQSNQLNAFSQDDLAVFQLIAEQAAIAIQNAQLYSQSQQFNQQLEQEVAQRTQDLHQAYEQLERLDQAKSDFIAVVAHELRTPLTIILSYAQILNQTPAVKNDPSMVQYVHNLSQGAERLHSIVNSMLEITKIDNNTITLSVRTLSLKDILTNVSRSFEQDLLARQLTLHTRPELTNLPPIQGDSTLLTKVFYHILVNAIKYTPDGGQITIAAEADEQGVELTIADTGIGIDPAFQELVFTKFYQTGKVNLHSSGTTKFKGGGAGLGLTIARGFVKAHHGRVWLTSAGHDEENLPGTTVHVWLPLTQPYK